MRAFILSCVAAIVIAGLGAIFLSFIQESAATAFSTESVRL